MEPRAISALEAIRSRIEEDLGLTEPVRDLVNFTEALEPREATRARLRAIAQRTRAAEGGKKVEPRSASRERFRGIAQRTGAAKPKRKLKPGTKMVFGKVVKEATGAEQVACAASGALGLKKGQKGDKKKLAREIAKRTKSKKLARKAAKMAQEF